jgi:hypothetical protein
MSKIEEEKILMHIFMHDWYRKDCVYCTEKYQERIINV